MDERTLVKSIAPIIGRKLPEFVQDQHETFVAFVKAYKEWLYQAGNAGDAVAALYDNRSIDTTPDAFVEYFRREFLETIPTETMADKRLLIKHIKEYYRAKGTEQSIKFLFQILYNETPELYYPTYDLLRASDGKWQQDYAIKTTNNPLVDYTALLSKVIVGNTSGATALVESISDYSTQVSGIVKEFKLNKSSITGTFSIGETISVNGVAVDITIESSIVEPAITAAGTGYAKGDIFIIRDATSNLNVLATGTVKTITATGGIVSVKLDSFPLDEVSLIGGTVDFTVSGDGNATGTLNFNALTIYPGAWLNDDSKLSSNKRLQDNYFWQDFSYQIKSSVPIDSYFDLLQKSVHPAGMLAFSEVISPEIAIDEVLAMPLSSSISIIYEMFAHKLALLSLSSTEWTILGLSEYLITYFTTYGGISPEDLHGGRTRAIDSNPYYPGLQNKSPDDLLTPPIPVGWGLYTPGSLIELS